MSSVGFSSDLDSSTSPPSGTRNSQRNPSSGSGRGSPTREPTPEQLQLSRNTSDAYSVSGAAVVVASPREGEEAPAAPQIVSTLYTTEAHLRKGSAPQYPSSALAEPPTTNTFAHSTPGEHSRPRASDHATLQKAIAVSSKWRAKNAEHMAQLYGVGAKAKKHAVSSKQSRFGSPTGGASSPIDTRALPADLEPNAAACGKPAGLLRYDSSDARGRGDAARDKPSQTMYFKSNRSSNPRRHVPTTQRVGSPSPNLVRHRGLEPMPQPQENRSKCAASPTNGALTDVNWKRRGSSPQGRRLEPLTMAERRLH